MAARLIVAVRPAIRLALLVAIVVAVAACASDAPPPSMIPASIGPSRSASATVDITRGEIARALGARRLILTDPQQPFRPAESAALAGAPRAVYQVTLPADPEDGYIVVYEFLDPAAAAAAGAEQASWLASGPGRVQWPQGAIHIIRQVGPTIVLYSWLPAAADDPQAPDVDAALRTVGTDIPVPS